MFLLCTSTSTALAATFTGLGDLPGGAFRSDALAVSHDGRFVVGQSEAGTPTGDFFQAFFWSAPTGIVGLGAFAWR